MALIWMGKTDMHDALWHHKTPEICPNCGEHMEGDGYGSPYRCPNALEDDWWYEAPDSDLGFVVLMMIMMSLQKWMSGHLLIRTVNERRRIITV